MKISQKELMQKELRQKETKKRITMKEVAKELLRDKGYKEEEIHTEYPIWGGVNGAGRGFVQEKFSSITDTHLH